MNLSDTVATFQADCELVHEFTKGDKTVVVNGEAGSYPSLAKIAADSQLALTDIIQEVNEQLDVSQSTITTVNETLAGLFHLASGIVGKTYSFADTLELRIKHNMGTRVFSTTIIASDNAEVKASISPIDDNEFKVGFTDPESGRINVIFYLNP